MLQELITWLASDNGTNVHIAVIVSLLLGGLGFPIPEDLPLLLAGVAAAKGIVALQAIFVTCYVGVIAADLLIYAIGLLFGKRILNAGKRSPFFPSITEEKINQIRDGLRRRRFFYIFMGRHLFPLRSATFLIAGALHLPFLEFLVSDAIAALISVSLVIGIGYYLGEQLTPEVIALLEAEAKPYLFLAVIFVIGFFLIRRVLRKNRTRKAIASANVIEKQFQPQARAAFSPLDEEKEETRKVTEV